jgi:hypothetical protein
LAIGVGLWVLTWVLSPVFGGGGPQLEEPERLSTGGPHN